MKKISRRLFIFVGILMGLAACQPTHEHHFTRYDYDGEDHWRYCECGTIEPGSTVPHDFTDVILTPATINAEGQIQRSCTCGYSTTQSYSLTEEEKSTIKANELMDSISKLLAKSTATLAEAEALKASYDALDDATKAKVVNIESLEEFILSRQHNHAYTTKKYNDTYHWMECSCGDKQELIQHTFTETVKEPATLTEAGIKTFTCDCGYSKDLSYELTETEKVTKLIEEINKLESSDYERALELEEVYNLLSTEGKALVTNYSKLEGINANNPVKGVMELITKIGVSYQNETKINAARTAYNQLSATLKEKVSNYDVLVGAESDLAAYKLLDLDDTTTLQQMVINMAFNYWFQGNQIQYDQYTQRRNPGAAPEDGYADNITYLDCSSFCNSIYYNLFGKQIIASTSDKEITASSVSTANVNSYAKTFVNNANHTDIIFYADELGGANDISKKGPQNDSTAATIRNMMQPGDCYTYRHGSAGHIMLYLGTLSDGKDYFMHCSGSAGATTSEATTQGPSGREKEDANKYERDYGSVILDPAEIVFESAKGKGSISNKYTGGSTNRYIFADANTAWSVIRPLNRMKKIGATLKTNAASRLLYPYLDIQKAVDVGNYHSAVKNSEVTYTLTIKNISSHVVPNEQIKSFSKNIPYINVEETIPANVEFVSCSDGGIVNGNKLIWNFAGLNPGQTKTITYTYKYTGEIGSEVADYDTYVNGIRANKLCNNIRANLDMSKLVTAVEASIGETLSSSYTSIFIVNMYKEAFGIDLKTHKNAQGEYDGPLCYIDSSDGSAKLGDNTFKNYTFDSSFDRLHTGRFEKLIPNIMFGGIKYRAANPNDNNNLRNVLPSHMEVGDIISASFDGENTVFLYMGPTAVYKVNKDTKVLEKVYDTTTEVTEFLHTLPYYWGYVIIRPSLSPLYV